MASFSDHDKEGGNELPTLPRRTSKKDNDTVN